MHGRRAVHSHLPFIKAMHARGYSLNSCCGKNSCWVTPSKSDWNISANIGSLTTFERSYSVSDVSRIQPCRSFADVRPPKFVDLTARAYNAVFDKFVRSFSPDRFRPSGVALSDPPCNSTSRSMVRQCIGPSLSMSSLLRSLQHRSRVSLASLVL